MYNRRKTGKDLRKELFLSYWQTIPWFTLVTNVEIEGQPRSILFVDVCTSERKAIMI
jgi:hypothetical protein